MHKVSSLLLSTILLTSCVTGQTVSSDNISLSYEKMPASQAKQLVVRAEEILGQLEAYLNQRADSTIKINILDFEDDNKAHAIHRDSLIEIPVTKFRGAQLDYVLVHEIGHLVACPSFLGSSLLNEGLAVHLHSKFAEYRSRRTGKIVDLHKTVAQAFMPQRGLVPLSVLIHDNLAFGNYLKGREAAMGRSQAYIQAGSFVKFLVDTYGISKFMQAYRKAPFEMVYNKPLAELEKEWVTFLKKS